MSKWEFARNHADLGRSRARAHSSTGEFLHREWGVVWRAPATFVVDALLIAGGAWVGGISLAHEVMDAWLEFIGRGHPHIPADGDWRVWRVTSRTAFAEV